MDEKIVLTNDQAMALAISEAYKGAPHVSPNPLVGCVVLSSKNEFLASGYHHKYGDHHAEVDALNKLKPEQLKNAKIFVTLEPCAHEGKTPSCAKRIATLPIAEVIYGLTDPNPLVAGQGAAIISAGITAREYQGPLKSDLEDLCEIFLKNFTEKKTFVAGKVAQSLDGQIALKTGESQWITTEASREYVHELRSWYDAVLVGRGTIEIDNPSLNIRHSRIIKENKLIILDPTAKLIQKIKSGADYKFLKAHKSENILFAVNKKTNDFNYQQIEFSDLQNLLNNLWVLNIKSIFIEGGAKTYSSFLTENLIDRLHVFTATAVIGSANGLSWTTDFSTNKLSQKKILRNIKTKIFDSDIYITGRLSY